MRKFNSTEKVKSKEEAMEMIRKMENMFGATEIIEEGNEIYQVATDGFTIKYIIQ